MFKCWISDFNKLFSLDDIDRYKHYKQSTDQSILEYLLSEKISHPTSPALDLKQQAVNNNISQGNQEPIYIDSPPEQIERSFEECSGTIEINDGLGFTIINEHHQNQAQDHNTNKNIRDRENFGLLTFINLYETFKIPSIKQYIYDQFYSIQLLCHEISLWVTWGIIFVTDGIKDMAQFFIENILTYAFITACLLAGILLGHATEGCLDD
eukprot:UN28769